MICRCCGAWATTTGGCIRCIASLWCGHCQAQFCGNHGQEAFANHREKCYGINTVNITVTPAANNFPISEMD